MWACLKYSMKSHMISEVDTGACNIIIHSIVYATYSQNSFSYMQIKLTFIQQSLVFLKIRIEFQEHKFPF